MSARELVQLSADLCLMSAAIFVLTAIAVSVLSGGSFGGDK